MYSAPDSYYDDLTAMERRITVQIAMGANIDQTAADDVTAIEGSFLEMSNPQQVIDSNYIITSGLATFEGAGIPSASSAGMVAPPIEATAYPPEAGIWSDAISGADGTIEWEFTIRLSKVHESAFSVYTQDVHIARGRIRYYSGDALTRDVTLESTSAVFADTEGAEYDRITVTVLELTAPYSHVRIAEVEFGASVTLSNQVLGETVTLITEYDHTGQSIPLSEVQFSLLNVEGEYDADNPDTLLDTIPLWTPLDLSFTQIVGDRQTTIPMGTFYITDRAGSDVLLDVTAQDSRAILQNIMRAITVSPEQSIGTMYEALLTDLQIPYQIDDAAYDVYPDNAVNLAERGTDVDLLTQVRYIAEYYGVDLIPGRDGYLHVTVGDQGDTARGMAADLLMAYPAAASSQTYNYIEVQYGAADSMQTYSLDLRTNESEVRSALSISNPLILDEANARRIAEALAPRVGVSLYQAEAIADATLEPRDSVPIEGRWSRDAPMSYRLTSIEYTFDGSLTMTVKGYRT